MKAKYILLLALLLGISACGGTAPNENAPQKNPTAIFTLTATSTATELPALNPVEDALPPTPTATFTPSPTPLICAEPLTPADGSDFPAPEKVIFSWTAMENAENYVLSITLPSGDSTIFESETTKTTRYIESFTQGGEYRWDVTALNAAGEEICTSETFTFTKAISEIAPESEKKDNKDDDSNGDVSPPPPPDWED